MGDVVVSECGGLKSQKRAQWVVVSVDVRARTHAPTRHARVCMEMVAKQRNVGRAE